LQLAERVDHPRNGASHLGSTESFMLVGYVSDEYYAALPGVSLEFQGTSGERVVTRSSASGAIHADLAPGSYEVCLAKPGFGSKRVQVTISSSAPYQFRLLSDRVLGYACPKWCRGGEGVEFRVHSVEPYKLGLWRYGYRKERVRNIG